MTDLTPQEARKLWVEALESGKYKQTTGQLRRRAGDPLDQAGYCCLGVLCELATAHGVIDGYSADAGDLLAYRSVMRWVGLDTPSGNYTGDYSLGAADSQLTQDNDNGVSFAEIATLIRSEPEGLFDPAPGS